MSAVREAKTVTGTEVGSVIQSHQVQTARAIANHFIELAEKEKNPLTPMQLIKLVYIAHGWNLAGYGRPLIKENVEAWKHGPVIGSLYRDLKEFGRGSVTHPIEGEDGVLYDPYPEDIMLAETVFRKYHGWTAFELLELTHKRGTPWDIVWNAYGGKELLNVFIPNELVRAYFLELGKRISKKDGGARDA